MSRFAGSNGYAVIAMALSAVLAACGGAAPSPSEAPPVAVSTLAVPPTDAGPEAPPAPSGTRDFAALNVCELVTPEEVLELAGGGTLDGEPNQQGEATFSMCWYSLDAPSGAYEYYIVYVESADLGEFALEAEEAGDPLAGLGDESRLWFEEDEDQFRLLVILRGDYALDIAGTDSEVMLEIARLLIERLG
ncbi:MAG TPA: hypothetical protein VFI11_05250 [Anaerolineales bacterium]|nr:hypothetical protein [Anaerolineales bacterium]